MSQTLKRSNERLKSSVLKAVSDGIVSDSEGSTIGNFFCRNNVCWCVLGKNVLQSWLSLGISDIALTPFLTLLSSWSALLPLKYMTDNYLVWLFCSLAYWWLGYRRSKHRKSLALKIAGIYTCDTSFAVCLFLVANGALFVQKWWILGFTIMVVCRNDVLLGLQFWASLSIPGFWIEDFVIPGSHWDYGILLKYRITTVMWEP